MLCPHCLEHFHEDWVYMAVVQEKGKGFTAGFWGVGSTTCAACQRVIITLGKLRQVATPGGAISFAPDQPMTLVHPKAISRSPIPSEVPLEFAKVYSEACSVLPDSEAASAALSRRCLQHLLREKAKVKKDDLAKEIQQALDSKQLPTHLAEDLDAIRNVGNFAAHPLKSTNTGEIVDVEPHEAEWLLNVIEGLFDFYFVQLARAKAKRDALNAKLQEVGKPPMKQP